MKKGIILLLVAVMALAIFAGCSSNNTSSAPAQSSSTISYASPETVAADNTGFNEEEVAKSIKYKSYKYKSYSYNYLVLVLKNESKYDCKLETEVTLFDKKGKIVDTASTTITAFAAGTESVVKFSTKEDYEKFEVQFSASELTYYKTVVKDLKYTVDTATDKAIVSITNNSKDKTALFAKAYAIFFNKGKVVYTNLVYIGDSKSEIKPGKTQRRQIPCYEKFDDVKVYVDSYAKAE